ncbi:exopolysaccharide biosynthesis polyprenyl glycosylphosphotransferase [Hymenobacter sp. BT186]|uniref:Exopolysaccharide biosynthesis polyprenyl glycosylphosphotransferase n=1 Tax=Hymenobacter telluris TaxID=2816474 RepID=A0A939ETP1_9BACT|nr:exopolysaccharide biosynthesis polyprenyl glycosylphosphotransferase [Hymenobacter telluris]MBO0356959.1 exopolysaccharide biosynthesis polyprenyl glycosylphosphotransferase [Hymenobacter telluris]MBW3372986.1 exopolysaccharide biosynthesis polyprenyl glycosylphosphotransferase [Hymenobacter norwichensis]
MLRLGEIDSAEDLYYSRQSPVVLGAFLRKRIFDVVFAGLVAILLLSWLVPLIALCIKLDSRGPVFFRQLRTGKHGKPFYCLKFRSMRTSADADRTQASRHDSRITRLGAFLRKTSLDELPQFFNVLKGEMSVVGPRPHMLRHTEDYAQVIDNFMDRHLIMPGITGLAQVSGYRGETKEVRAMVDRVRADIRYLRNWSFLLDLKIVLLTIWQVIKPDEHTF